MLTEYTPLRKPGLATFALSDMGTSKHLTSKYHENKNYKKCIDFISFFWIGSARCSNCSKKDVQNSKVCGEEIMHCK